VSCAGGYQHASPLLHADVDADCAVWRSWASACQCSAMRSPGPELLGGDEADSQNRA
jgi:hypothetical protein